MTKVRGALAIFVVAACVAIGSAPAQAADAVVIREVDTTDAKKIQVTVLKPPVASADSQIKISENGKPVTNASIATPAEADLKMGVALVVDMSDSTKNGDQATKIKEAAAAMIAAMTPNQKMALIAANGEARTVVNFTDDKKILTDSVNNLGPSNQNALWDSVHLAATQFANSTEQMQANIVVVSASPDQLSRDGAYTNALAQARTTKAAVFTVGIRQRGSVDVGNLQELAAQTGGRYIETSDAATSTQILAGVMKTLNDQAVITYPSMGGKALDIAVSIGSGVATAHAALGTVSAGANVAPVVIEGSKGPDFLSGPIGLILVAVISLMFVGLLLYGIVEILSSDKNQLRRALRPYSDSNDDRSDVSKLADSEIIKKAVAATAKAAQDRGLLEIIQRRLEQADLPLRPAEALFFTAVISFIAMLLGAVLFGILGVGAAFVITLYAPVFITNFLAKMRKRKFTGQLPDTLQLLSGSLRAGYSLVQGLDAVSKQAEAPMGTELQRAMAEARLGRPVEEALQEISDRMASDDFEWAVMAIKIQREVGGNLAELLMTVSETMVARERLRREVKSLTAEGRISAIVLVALPPGIGLIISVLNPVYMAPLLHETLGQLALVVAGVMIGFGYWLMMKMIEIEA